MKILMRVFGMSVIMMLSVLMVFQMMSMNIRRDELTTCISTAMTSTQIIMQEQIEDQVYGTNTKRKEITSNEEYLEEFASNFYKLINSDSKYKIKVFGIDYTKGFIDIEIESTYIMFNGEEKTISSRKTSIVDVLMDEEEGE